MDRFLKCLIWLSIGVFGAWMSNKGGCVEFIYRTNTAVLLLVTLTMLFSYLITGMERKLQEEVVKKKGNKLLKYWTSFVAGMVFANMFLSNGMWY